MSRGSNCWDNDDQEQYFDHVKDETKDKIIGCITYDDWIDYYNNDRPQWDLAYLTPSEYYNYSITGQYPINLKELPSKKKSIQHIIYRMTFEILQKFDADVKQFYFSQNNYF